MISVWRNRLSGCSFVILLRGSINRIILHGKYIVMITILFTPRTRAHTYTCTCTNTRRIKRVLLCIPICTTCRDCLSQVEIYRLCDVSILRKSRYQVKPISSLSLSLSLPPLCFSRGMISRCSIESRLFAAMVAINIGRYVSAAVINTILVIGRRSAIRTDGQSGCRRDAIGRIRVARGGTRGQSTGR